MAFQQPLQDIFGHVAGNAYWRLSSFSFDRLGRTANLHFHAWVDKAAHDAGSSPVAVKSYALAGDEFDQISQMLTQGFGAQVYAYARNKKDVSTGSQNEDGTPVTVSFFEQATDVV